MKRILLLAVAIVFVSFIMTQTTQAQETNKKDDINSNVQGTNKIEAPQAITDKIKFKNETGNAIITITDEGSNKGSITIPSATAAPTTTTANKLYNINGTLNFNGTELSTAGSAGVWTKTGINVHLTNNGDLVGIGTSNPNGTLDVRSAGIDEGATIELGNSDMSHQLTLFGGRQNDPNPFIRWTHGDPFRFATTSAGFTEVMRIDTNGNVGIGTTSPSEKLEVAGQVKITGGSPGAGKVLTSDAAGLASWETLSSGGYSIGDFTQGGIVFWVDETGEHGLVCAKEDQNGGSTIRWYAGTNGNTQAKGDGPFSGEMNTAIIISAQVAIGDDGTTYAARICSELQITEGGKTYGDWYLPSKQELNLMYETSEKQGYIGKNFRSTNFPIYFLYSTNKNVIC